MLWGESLGSAVAVAIGAGHRVSRMVLEASFTSAVDVGARLLVFTSAPLDEGPISLGSADREGDRTNTFPAWHSRQVVSIALGERLYALGKQPKRFLRFPNGGHEDLDTYGAQNAFRAFLAQP